MKNSILFLSCLLLIACSGGSAKKSSTVAHKTTKEAETTKVEIKAVKKSPTLEVVEQEKIPLKVQKNSAVINKLLADAEKSIQLGKSFEAVATLERALRISPRNPGVFYKLATVRLGQGRFKLAENLAKKSELLAEGNALLKQKNWLLIADARQQAGDSKGADFAKQKARKYRN